MPPRLPRNEMRMLHRGIHIKNRKDTGIECLEYLAPISLILLKEFFLKSFFESRPPISGLTICKIIQFHGPNEFAEEFRLKRGNAHEPAIPTAITAIKRNVTGQEVLSSTHFEIPIFPDSREEGHEICNPVDNSGIDYLPFVRPRALEQCGSDTSNEKHRSATEIADKVERYRRRRIARSHLRQNTRQTDIIQIMASTLRQGTCLPPTGHSTVDKSLVTHERYLRP